MTRIILFDGVCHFCSQSVQFIIKRDPDRIFRFASLQSEAGVKLLKTSGLDENVNSFVFIDDGKCYLKSEAALRVAKHLTGFWKFLSIFLIVPRPIRDFVYQFVAKHRHKFFRKQERCLLPTTELRERLIE